MYMDSSNTMEALQESFLQAAFRPSAITTHHSYLSEVVNKDHDIEDGIIIDLGLSLGTSLQSNQAYHQQSSSGHCIFVNPGEYGELMGWSDQLNNPYNMRSSSSNVYRTMMILQKDHDHEETEGVVQSKERWAYVKVNMEGVVVGRKVCILEHAGYTSLAVQLEDMFGRHCATGRLQLFDAESEFTLYYKDSNEHWRTVGDVPWKEFVDCVKRLRITRKDEALFVPHSSSSFT